MATSSQQLATVIFADTCTLHYASLFLQLAQRRHAWPFRSSADKADALTGLPGSDGYMRGLRKGGDVVSYLRDVCADGGRVYHSPLTKLEMVFNSLRGQAMLRAARSSVPGRWWSRVVEEEIATELCVGNYRSAAREAAALEPRFDRADIVLEAFPSQQIADIWALAHELLCSVFMGVQDCIVYSGALLSMADQLVTYDRYLIEVAKNIHSPEPGDARSQRVRNEIVCRLANALGCAEAEVCIPAVATIPKVFKA